MMTSRGMLGCGACTSSVDMVEGISHRPGQKGDASNCSDVKEWGCGLWTRAAEEGACPQCPSFSPLKTRVLEFRATCSLGGPWNNICPALGQRPRLPLRHWRSATHLQRQT